MLQIVTHTKMESKYTSKNIGTREFIVNIQITYCINVNYFILLILTTLLYIS